jgi:hypothetical protein
MVPYMTMLHLSRVVAGITANLWDDLAGVKAETFRF